MEQNYSLMAQSRANYYTAGSPVQFVRVELLKGDMNGEVAVCLTFKNVGTEPLTGLVIHFKCKDASGQVLCEDDFYYEQLDIQPGGLFGSDDAVYVSDVPVSSVEIEQDRAFLNGRGVDLRGYKRVRLKAPRVLPATIARALQNTTGNEMLTCLPQDTENGWFCACGAFHPKEENVQVCSECGGDRVYIKAALTRILEEEAARQAGARQQREVAAAEPKPAAPSAPSVSSAAASAAATAAAVQAAIDREEAQPAPQMEPPAPEYPTDAEAERVQRFAPNGRLYDDEAEEDDEVDGTRTFDAAEGDYDDEDDYEERPARKRRGRYADDEEESEEDVLAERIIRWAPPITAVICALMIAVSLVYHFVIA